MPTPLLGRSCLRFARDAWSIRWTRGWSGVLDGSRSLLRRQPLPRRPGRRPRGARSHCPPGVRAAAAARSISPYEQSAARALAKLRSGGSDALIIDARGEPGCIEESSARSRSSAASSASTTCRGCISRDKAWMVVDGEPRSAALAFEAGRLHLGGVVPVEGAGGWEAIWERIAETTARGRGGKIALCLAGGGTEGLLYELGVLRALEQFLPQYRIEDVDILCGISAGAILGGLLANGIGPRRDRRRPPRPGAQGRAHPPERPLRPERRRARPPRRPPFVGRRPRTPQPRLRPLPPPPGGRLRGRAASSAGSPGSSRARE